MSRIDILNIHFDSATATEASDRIFSECKNKKALPFTVVTPNPIMVMNARKNEQLLSALAAADLSLADGVGIVSAAKRMGTPLPERVTGIDTGCAVLERLAEVGGSVYFLGAKHGVAELAADKITEKLSSLRVVGTHHGYFDNDEKVLSDIKEKTPDLLIVCLGSPRQEIWAYENRKKLTGVGAVICLGGALDVWSGNLRRAPRLFIKMHLEWLWRMICEPQRLSALPKMIKFRYLTRKSRQNR